VADVKLQGQRLREITAQAIDEVGRLARGLHPTVLDDHGLGVALSRYAAEYTKTHNISVDLTLNEIDSFSLPSGIQIALYRILQEALTNAATHSGAKAVSIRFTGSATDVEVEVIDDGCGFDAKAVAVSSHRLGIQSMPERAAMLGGRSVSFISAREPRFWCKSHLPARTCSPCRVRGALEMPARTHTIRVMIADDHAILRAGLRMLVNAQADMEVVSEAPDGEKAVQTARETRPDVALLDLTMPRVGGMKALQQMARDCRETRVLVLTMHDDPAYLRSTLAAGASGYLLKRAVDSELLAAIRAVHRGGIFVDPRLANVLVQDLLATRSTKAGSTRPANILSHRELQVLGLVARGYTSAEIAKQIFVDVKTIETYRSRLADKLGLRTRSDVIRMAVQMGLLTPETLENEPGGPAR